MAIETEAKYSVGGVLFDQPFKIRRLGHFGLNAYRMSEALPADEEEDPSRPARAGDGVSSIMITSNDLAGAWALRPDGQPMLPLTPGEPRQREFAFRAGAFTYVGTPRGLRLERGVTSSLRAKRRNPEVPAAKQKAGLPRRKCSSQ